jgi:hypothetical protein
MRAFEGQRSDNQPVKRTTEEKQRQLRELRDAFAGLKSHTSPALRDSMRQRIATLEKELGTRPAGASAPQAPATPQQTRRYPARP